MLALFFYGRDKLQFGPFSATIMRKLAADDEIRFTDLVWQEGETRKLPAWKVKNLFAISPPDPSLGVPLPPLAAEEELEPAADALSGDQAYEPEQLLSAEPVASMQKLVHEARQRAKEVPRTKRIISIKGGLLMGQDGVNVNYRKKCPVCGFEDVCRSTAVIRVGSTRIGYYCRPCRKGRSVEMQGTNG